MDNQLDIHLNNWKVWVQNEKRLSPYTLKSYQIDLRSFLDFLFIYNNETININIIYNLNEDHLLGWFYERLKNGISHRSNARALSSLKSFLRFLIKKKVIQNSKILNIKGPKFLDSLPRPLSENQILKIFDEIKKEKKQWVMIRNLISIILMWGYGLRISEVLNLKLKDLNNDEIRILGKGNKIRIIPISGEVTKIIKIMLEVSQFRFTKDDFIFLGVQGKKLKPEIIQRLIRKIRNEVILPSNTTPHSLRHTFATELLHNFADLRSIQELLGHSSLSTTQKYTSVNTDHLRKMLEKSHPRAK